MLPKDVVESLPKDTDTSPEMICRWLISPSGLSTPPVYRYISYLKQILELACATAEVYDLRSGKDAMGKKEHLRHIGPHELMYIANQLYILDSFGVQGSLLECGVSHGYSTCVLSHACARLGRTLYAADSFQGLPSTRTDEAFFREHDYACSLDDVKRNIAYLGNPQSVEYIGGFYAESLKDFSREICILWLDVDLFESARDVMEHVFDSLDRRGTIFTHEFTDFHNKVYTKDSKTPPGAVYSSLESRSIKPRSSHIMRYFGSIGFESSIQFDAYKLLPCILEALLRMDDRWRKYRDLRECRTVKTAFAANRALNRLIGRHCGGQ